MTLVEIGTTLSTIRNDSTWYRTKNCSSRRSSLRRTFSFFAHMSHMLNLAILLDVSQAPCRPRPHFCEHSGSSAVFRTLCLQKSHFGSYKSIAFFQIIIVKSNSAHHIRTLRTRLFFTLAFVACLASEWQSRQRQMFVLSSRPLSRTSLPFCKGTGLFCTSPCKSRNQDQQSVRKSVSKQCYRSTW